MQLILRKFMFSDITRRNIINVLPFTNLVVTGKLQGKYIVKYFQFSLNNAYVKSPFSGPYLVQVSGTNNIDTDFRWF